MLEYRPLGWLVLGLLVVVACSGTQVTAQSERRGGFQRGGQEASGGQEGRGGQEASGPAREQRGGFRGGAGGRDGSGGRDETPSEAPRGRGGRGEGGPGASENRGGENRPSTGRGSEGRGTEGRGTEGRGSEGRGSEGRGSEGRGSEGRGSEGRGTEGRGSQRRGGEERGEERGEEEGGRRRAPSRSRGESAGTLRDQVINQLVALDVNQDGRLDPIDGEGNVLSTTIMAKVGLDPGLPVHVETLRGLINQIDLEKIQLDAEAGIRAEDAVSSFDFPSVPRNRAATSDFDGHPVLTDTQPYEERYSALIREEVRSLLARYDANRNGILDSDEIPNIPWGPPSPLESDLDQNGILTEIELAERLNTLPTAGQSSRRTRTRGAADPSADAARAEREAERAAAAAERRERERERQNSGTDRVATYVKDLVTRFDKDGDGMMSLEEAGEMRNPPPKSADSDKDGKLSDAELYAYYSDGQSPSSSSSKPSSQSSREAAADRGPLPGTIMWEGELGAPKSNSGSDWPSALSDKDQNLDGMVSLAEFSAEPDAAQREAFARWDTNNDGFITKSESAGGNRSGSGSDNSNRSTSSRGAAGRSSAGRSSAGGAEGGTTGGRSASRSRRGSTANNQEQRDESQPTENSNPQRGTGSSQAPSDSLRYNIFGN